MKPGVLEDQFYLDGIAEYDPILVGDEVGITHYAQQGSYSDRDLINEEGFFSEIEFTAEAMDSIRDLGKKIVLLVGDSYTSGCCADAYSQSFAGLLTGSDEYEILNFGVGGTDPLQYELVVKKYLPLLKPDAVVVVSYLGNDEMPYDRTPKPLIPICYPIKDGHWLNSEYPIYYNRADTHLENFEDAKAFYYTYYSLRSEQSNFFEKLIRPSIILSKVYLFLRITSRHYKLDDEIYTPHVHPRFSYNHFKAIADFCQGEDVPVEFTTIASPVDIENNVEVRKEYNYFFNEIEWDLPENLSLDDYDGMSIVSHFNNLGHRKYADFLHPLILKQLNN